MQNIVDVIVSKVSAWNSVSTYPHRFGGTEFRYGKPEIGHIHRNGITDIPFPVKISDELVKEKIALPHHILPESGWISFYVKNDEDVKTAVLLFRLSYLRYAIKRDKNNFVYKEELEKMDLSEPIKKIYAKMFS